jgi:Zn-dependent peptidase ImmA (M78 family)
MNRREATLNGVKAAAALHEQFGTRGFIESRKRGNVDVFGSILNKNADLLFRPLEGLLGAYLEGPGVLISTNRQLSVQRFTGAHELGHISMNHVPCVDGMEILQDEGLKNSGPAEWEANAFASEFLLPRWLLAHHARLQGWGREDIKSPVAVYQLSLRTGASYQATVHALAKHKIVDVDVQSQLLGIQPKAIKQQLLKDYSPENWHRDVWLITEKDEDGVIEGQPDDLFLLRFNEKSGSGYLWNFERLEEEGFAVLTDDQIDNQSEDIVGSDVLRVVRAQPEKAQRGELRFHHARPWQTETIPQEQFGLRYDLFGKESGLPRSQRGELAA